MLNLKKLIIMYLVDEGNARTYSHCNYMITLFSSVLFYVLFLFSASMCHRTHRSSTTCFLMESGQYLSPGAQYLVSWDVLCTLRRMGDLDIRRQIKRLQYILPF